MRWQWMIGNKHTARYYRFSTACFTAFHDLVVCKKGTSMTRKQIFVQRFSYSGDKRKYPIPSLVQPSDFSTRLRLYITIVFDFLCSFCWALAFHLSPFVALHTQRSQFQLFCVWRDHTDVASYISTAFALCHNHRKVSCFFSEFLEHSRAHHIPNITASDTTLCEGHPGYNHHLH